MKENVSDPVHDKSREDKRDRESPFGRIVRMFFTDNGQAVFAKYAPCYSYPDTGEFEYRLPMERKARLSFPDLTLGGNIYKFAPDFDVEDFTPLLQIIEENLSLVTSDNHFNLAKYRESPYRYVLEHGFVCNRFQSDCIRRLSGKFKQDVKSFIDDTTFNIMHAFKKLSLREDHWNRLSLVEMTNLFVNNFGVYVNVLPNSALVAELEMLTRARLDVLECRHLSTVYRIHETGRVYQIQKIDSENTYWIFNDYEEYISVQPIDEPENFFRLSPIYSVIFVKGHDTFIKSRICTARIIDDKAKSEVYVDDYKFVPGIDEEAKNKEIKEFRKKVFALKHKLPLARYQTVKAKANYARYLSHFNSAPIDLYL